MQRSIGKRIRMDEPPPPEYDTTNPMSPEDNADVHDAFSTSYGDDMYSNDYGQALADYGVSDNQVASFHLQGQLDLHHHDLPPTPVLDTPQNTYNDSLINLKGRVTRSRLKNAVNPPSDVQSHTYSECGIKRPFPEERFLRSRRPRRNYFEGSGNITSLYVIIKAARTPIPTIVDEWIEAYKANRSSALLGLMQFFISASGCKGRVTEDMATDMEHASIIRKMTEEFDEESGEYPLIMSGLQWKKFRTSFSDFIGQLVKQCQYSIIYDQYLMDNVISLLTGLSDSQVRAFRHTATLAAMKLMTALVDVALVVSVNLDNTQRQYDSERQKARDKRASDRLENLLTKKQELEENMDEIKNMLTYMFKSVFVHRYRDTLPEIRSICMSEIGNWMEKFHQNFLDDSYLKYIGWTLHDKVGEVRLKCLQALQPLYASEELKGKLELFTSKFKDRIVAMTLDKEYDVAVQAVRLVISILKYHRDILSDKDCEHVYELVYSSHRAVAQSAGEFLNERLFVPEEASVIQRTKRGKKRLPNTPLIRDLVQFFIESELHEHGAYLVDSLIESNPMMKDWECMTDLLTEEPGVNEEPLDDRQETSLIELMVCCVKQAATGEAPVGRAPSRKIPTVKEVKQIQDDRQKLTEHFIAVLPQLLDRYSADPDKLTNLLTIPQYFDLEIYTSSRQEANLDLLLRKIQNITEKHHDTDVLETCAKTLELLCSEGYAIYTRCDVQRSTIIDRVVNKYKEAMNDWSSLIEGHDIPDDDDTYNVVNSLKKLAIFYSCHNLRNWDIKASIFKEIEEAKDSCSSLPEEAIKYCISSCFFCVLWDMHHIQDLFEAGGPIDDDIIECKSKLIKLMEVMKGMLTQGHKQHHKEEAFLVICDLLVMFSNQLYTSKNSALSGLVYEADSSVQVLLNNFIQCYVFTHEEDEELDEHAKIAELHKRRNFLASYCKLIVYCIIPMHCAVDIFKHYHKSYNYYGDIIKATLSKAREINKVRCAYAVITSLMSSYKTLQEKAVGKRVSRNIEDFVSLKELAKRFALSFGMDAVRNREAITAVHREGIIFSATMENAEDPSKPPPNLPFLEVLTEFTSKLLRQDKRTVLNYLDRRISVSISGNNIDDWQPLLMYRTGLVHGEQDTPSIPLKRSYFRKRKDVDDDFDEYDDLTYDSDFTARKVYG